MVTAADITRAVDTAGRKRRLSSWQVWGLILVAPYIAIFLAFVVYPVGYSFWLARDPHVYARLFDDPIFPRTVVTHWFS